MNATEIQRKIDSLHRQRITEANPAKAKAIAAEANALRFKLSRLK